jgi:peptide/nickel transport system permease protein
VSGDQPASPFHTTSDVEETTGDRIRAILDIYVLAPSRVLWNDKRALFGLATVAFFLLMGTVGVWLVPVPRANDGELLVQPFTTWEFPLGTDELGKGIAASIVHATPAMLKMILAGAIFSSGMGAVWGIVSGYKGGRFDRVMMSIADIVMTIPGLPLIVVLAAVLEPRDPFVVGIILSINAWAGFARVLRSQVLSIREESYVEAARTMGLPKWTIMAKDITPNVMPFIMVNFVTGARRVIISSVGLYFLGILPFTTLNWGVMMNLAYNSGALQNMESFHWFVIPMIVIVYLSLGLIMLGQGMDRIFNPRIRAKHSKKTDDVDPAEPAEPAGSDGPRPPMEGN